MRRNWLKMLFIVKNEWWIVDLTRRLDHKNERGRLLAGKGN